MVIEQLLEPPAAGKSDIAQFKMFVSFGIMKNDTHAAAFTGGDLADTMFHVYPVITRAAFCRAVTGGE
jgi:hypothetical protein